MLAAPPASFLSVDGRIRDSSASMRCKENVLVVNARDSDEAAEAGDGEEAHRKQHHGAEATRLGGCAPARAARAFHAAPADRLTKLKTETDNSLKSAIRALH